MGNLGFGRAVRKRRRPNKPFNPIARENARSGLTAALGFMTKTNPMHVGLGCSLVGVPVLFTLVYELGYGSLFPSAWDGVVLGFFILTGALMIYRLPLSSLGARVAASSAYALAMSGVLFFVALGVACG